MTSSRGTSTLAEDREADYALSIEDRLRRLELLAHSIASLDARYVNVTGDTMTGALTVGGLATTTLPSIIVPESADVVSSRASIQLGGWYTGQDVNANGTKDFYVSDGTLVPLLFPVGGHEMRVDGTMQLGGVWPPAPTTYQAMRRSDWATQGYGDLLGATDHYISANTAGTVYIRAGANDSNNQISVGTNIGLASTGQIALQSTGNNLIAQAVNIDLVLGAGRLYLGAGFARPGYLPLGRQVLSAGNRTSGGYFSFILNGIAISGVAGDQITVTYCATLYAGVAGGNWAAVAQVYGPSANVTGTNTINVTVFGSGQEYKWICFTDVFTLGAGNGGYTMTISGGTTSGGPITIINDWMTVDHIGIR